MGHSMYSALLVFILIKIVKFICANELRHRTENSDSLDGVFSKLLLRMPAAIFNQTIYTINMEQEHTYDAIIIGAGLGGLLAAGRLALQGKRIVIIERLNHTGGRFTAKHFRGAQISTGAVHMLPFGSNGVLAAALRRLNIAQYVHDAKMFGSFHVHGKHIHAHSLLSIWKVFGARNIGHMLQLGYAMVLPQQKPEENSITFAEWLDQQNISREKHPEIVLFFERISHFALSADLDQVSYLEIRKTFIQMLRYGPPGIVHGGCKSVADALEAFVRSHGGIFLLEHMVTHIQTQGKRVIGAQIFNKRTGEVFTALAPLVISDIGPEPTMQLTADAAESSDEQFAPQIQSAAGLKTHVLVQSSVMDQNGIMYCLDTKRIAGVVQPSLSDPSLAPLGKHLLITHQIWRPERESIAQAREYALQDLEYLLGPRANGTWEVLTMSQYYDRWPVNRAVQGKDVKPETLYEGLYCVGDAVKPSGYLMVEGVAQSVNVLMDILDPAPTETAAQKKNSSKLRALRWLIAPPPPHKMNGRASAKSGDT